MCRLLTPSSLRSRLLRPPGATGPLRVAQVPCAARERWPIDKEVAYFRLVQALECASSNESFSDDERFGHDEQLTHYLKWLIELEDLTGEKCAEFIKQRLYQVKRGVWLWLQEHVDSQFYAQAPESISEDSLKRCLSSAYDLRSAYVHAGTKFGDYIDPIQGRCGTAEIIPGDFLAICPDSELRKVLSNAPTFVGLERVVRYALTKALETEIAS